MSSGQAPHVDPYADREFARVLASRRGADAPDVARVPELYLAFACARRDPAAIAWFDAHYLREVDAAASRFDTLPVSIDDVRQRAREKLYLSDPPALAGYQGRCELRGWVRAFALHMLINIVTREARERPTDDGFFDAVVDASPDV